MTEELYPKGKRNMNSFDPEHENGVARFIHETGFLKSVPRTGWSFAGIQRPESVADHSFRVAVTAYLLGSLTNADADHAAVLGLFHDIPESRTQDIPSVGKGYLDKASDVDVMSDQASGLPPALRERLVDLVREYRAQVTAESQLAHDADKIECLAQAIEYRDQGFLQADLWVKGSYESISTEIGRLVGDAVKAHPANDWWAKFVSNYRRPSTPEPTPAPELER